MSHEQNNPDHALAAHIIIAARNLNLLVLEAQQKGLNVSFKIKKGKAEMVRASIAEPCDGNHDGAVEYVEPHTTRPMLVGGDDDLDTKTVALRKRSR
jgi:hypothetical protein